MMNTLLILLLATVSISAQALSPRNANYTINARLDPATDSITGSLTIRWRNITSQSTDHIVMHHYMNAFKSMNSTFMKTSGGRHRGVEFTKEFGSLELSTLFINGEDKLPDLMFIQPDDENPTDSTLSKIPLGFDVEPGDSLTIQIDFMTVMPSIFARTGHGKTAHSRDYYLVAQWFPKIAVLEEEGWNQHQFHVNTEFFSDFGVYDVTVSVPDSFVVGATGIIQQERTTDGWTTRRFRAEDVHDFAWTAWPHFVEATGEFEHTKIRLLTIAEQPQDEIQDQINVLIDAMKYMKERIRPFPWTHITMVNPPTGAGGSGGMEYPMFITAGYSADAPKSSTFRYESVTIHEFVHNYFQGFIASNEFEHAFMDEGFTQYFDGEIIEHIGRPAIQIDDILVQGLDAYRLSFITNPPDQAILTYSLETDSSNYGLNSYTRPAALLKTLRNWIGDDEFYRGMKAYVRKWEFRHPYPDDFFAVMDSVSMTDLKPFFQQFFVENKYVDYRVDSVIQYESDENAQYIVDEPGSDDLFTEIIIRNGQDGWFPSPVKVLTEGGAELLIETWDYRSDDVSLTVSSKTPIIAVSIDPERINLNDLNLTNNRWVIENRAGNAATIGLMVRVMRNLLQWMGGL